ncbi:MAG: hypothetical protein AABY64_11095 [Bdellovibrionota bacterium]
MAELQFCRRILIELLFSKKNSDDHVKDFCQFAVGIHGPVDQESGMIINLVDVDKILTIFVQKFEKSRVSNIFLFLQESRIFLQEHFAEFGCSPQVLFLRTAQGELQWSAPWREYDLKYSQNKKILVKGKTPSTLEIKKFFVQQRGTSVDLFKKFSANELRNLWSLRDRPDTLAQEMKKIKSLSAFGFSDESSQCHRGFELSFQEFSAKTFRE